ncbi:MAG: accessory Sec system glycosylation chaperone GtfB [Eubacteriales bacterium]|nr:accessory Sec system glycosylation chaperone GtfB [Eubacteriales bacterium]
MVLLIDNWNADAARLVYSLKNAGYLFHAVVLQYDGFCAEGVSSPYEYFLYGGQVPEQCSPLYFDKLQIPEYFEMESSNSSGEVREFDTVRARVFYAEPRENRYVRIVDWLDGSGKVCCSDHYDRFGHRFAQTVLSEKQKPVHKTYYRPDGAEVITENFLTGDIILTWHGKELFFHTKTEFVLYYLQQAFEQIDRIFYNSLSFPFFVANQYCNRVKKLKDNVLFWQEGIGADIPGNMKGILEHDLAGTSVIAVQHKDAFENLQKLSIDQSRFAKLGFIYPRLRENAHSGNLLVFTNSDQIEQLEQLAVRLNDVHIHIAALTEMSAKLMQMVKYPNIQLYPVVTQKQIQTLWDSCDIYLDINHGGEILDAVETAFKNRELILGFQNTLHKMDLVTEKYIFTPDENGAAAMAEQIHNVLSDKNRMDEELEYQWKHANAETVEQYRKILR